MKNSILRAEALLNQGKYEESLLLCKKILSKKSKSVDTIRILAINYHSMKQFDLAINEFKKAISLNDKSAAIHNDLGNVYLEREMYKEASICYEKALNINPIMAEANLNLSICNYNNRQFALAEKFCKKAIVNSPQDSEAYYILGLIYYDQGKFADAENYLVKSLEAQKNKNLNNYNLDAYWGLFKLKVSQHRYEDALQIADLGIVSHTLSDQQLCTLLVGKAIINLLFGNVIESQEAIEQSRSLYLHQQDSRHMANMAIFHEYITKLLKIKNEDKSPNYISENTKPIYFISESHGLSPNGCIVEYANSTYRVQSLFIMGAKVKHFLEKNENKFQTSLTSLFEGLESGSKVVMAFGEIDCRTNEGIYTYSFKSKKNYKDIIETMISNYTSVLNNIAQAVGIEIIMYGVPSPHPLSFNHLSASEQQKFKNIIAYFNKRLEHECNAYNIPYLDVYSLTNSNGQSNNKYHIDNYHVSPNTVPELFSRLASD